MKKSNKESLYRFYLAHIKSSLQNGCYFESAWLSYALIEDRLTSLLRQTEPIGVKLSKKQAKKHTAGQIRMLGPKIVELTQRVKTDSLLRVQLPDTMLSRLNTWKDERNDLMHGMAAGTMTVTDIQAKIKVHAEEGDDISRKIAATSRRVKKKKKKAARKAGIQKP
jgi:hypothetical protein